MARVSIVDAKTENFGQVALYIKDDRCLDYLEELKKINLAEAKEQRCEFRAYKNRDVIIINDFESDESVSLFSEAAMKAGIKSAVVFPIFYKDMVYAVFTLYSDRKNFFDGDILDLINYLANDLTYAIERNIESESRKAFEKQLKVIYQAINNVNEAIVITDENKKIIMVNKSFEPLLGFKDIEVINKDISILNSGRHPNEFFKIMWSVLKHTGHWQGEMYIRLKDGSTIPTWTSITVIKDENNIIRNYICILTDLTGRKEIEDKILYLSNYDALTGLPNRVLFIDRLEQAIASAKRFNKKFALIYLDIDRFKTINDNLGHNFGDKLLEQIAARLKSIIRGTDTLSRPTGDEFYIIINNISDLDDVGTVIRKIFDKISEPFDIEGYKVNITASVGVTVYPEDGQNAGVIMRNAEAALYYAKELGRNTYQFYKAEMTTKSKYAFELKNRLKKALEDGEFVLFYQPKLCIKTCQIVGAEALIRWMHPERGLIPPNDFIHIAEYSGLIKQIGEWVIEEACNQLKEWRKKGLPEITVSVNVSSVQFQDRNLKKQVEINLKKSDILPRQIELELTETIIMKDSETAMQLLNALKAMNILISIDDFGTGYSSLSYLKRFPIDTIKIDRSFISSLTRANDEDTSIVRTIINLGKNLGLKVIAEGVETQEQLELLRKWGCDEYQGYYFSKPIPVNEFEQLLRKNNMYNN
jgi:diguanylate cyclase (GGDEF)-like protein/PAS domain S-box-containing protein